jgi:hypothetical protein
MRALKSVYENERVWPQKLLFSDTPLKEDPSEDTGTRPESRTKKTLNPAVKLTRIRIYKGVSTNNFVRLQIIFQPPARRMHETRPGRTAQWANYPRQPLAWIRTYHAYHAYHAPFSSDLPRIPRISRTISVGHFHRLEAENTHNFKRRLKQRT